MSLKEILAVCEGHGKNMSTQAAYLAGYCECIRWEFMKAKTEKAERKVLPDLYSFIFGALTQSDDIKGSFDKLNDKVATTRDAIIVKWLGEKYPD